MGKIEDVKKDHHFVFQKYMEEWIDPSVNALWILREKKKLFTTGTAGIAFKKFFYTIREINEEEKKLLNLFIATMHPAVQEQMKVIIDAYLLPIGNKAVIAEMEQFSIKRFGTKEKIPLEIKEEIEKCKNINQVQLNNTMEDFYCEIEGELASYIKQIKKEGIDFYYKFDKDNKYNFLFDICVQYFRTMALKERWIHNFGDALQSLNIDKMGIDMKKIELSNLSFFYFWYIQSATAYALAEKNAVVSLLCNDTSIPFITADQPIINLKCDYCKDVDQVEELELYYPISPSKALLIGWDCLDRKFVVVEDDVVLYNKAIANASQQFLIGNSKEVLEQFVDK